jgi:hypothetical protein
MQPPVSPEQRQAAKHQMMEQIKQGASVRQERRPQCGHHASCDRVSTAQAGASRRRERLHRRAAWSPDQAAWGGENLSHRDVPGNPLGLQSCAATSHPRTLRSLHQHQSIQPCACLPRTEPDPHAARKKKSSPPLLSEPEWQESAGCLLLLAAATETTLITQLCEALPTESATERPPFGGQFGCSASEALTHLTLSWGRRTAAHLGSARYTADGLARLSGRKRAYGYRYTEAFLSRGAPTQVGLSV